MSRILNSLDHADLRLADGRRLLDMRVSEIWRELAAQKMPVTPDMGKAAMIEVFKRQIEPELKKLRPGYGKQPITVDDQVMRYAAKVVSEQLSAPEPVRSRAPMRPIASTA